LLKFKTKYLNIRRAATFYEETFEIPRSSVSVKLLPRGKGSKEDGLELFIGDKLSML